MSDEPELLFRDLDLAPDLLAAVEALGYEQPTPIQAAAIPPLLAGRDMLGQAQTGTGKTAAFALPLLQKLDLSRRGVQAIVLTPTRELALQVAEAVRAYGRRLGDRGVRVLPVYGGQPIHIQRKALADGVPVVIGTPGRVKDHLQRGSLKLDGVSFFGLDEADEMLNMGFLEDVEWILEHAPASRQIALFSATLPAPIRKIAERHLNDPADVHIDRRSVAVPGIEQFSVHALRHQKPEALERLLELEDHEAVLVFVGTQRMAAELAERLAGHGHGAECVHGGMSQDQREAVVRRLRARRTQIMVATDVAARGLDVDHIGLVINYDLPRDPEVYVHRVGRTGRAGRVGRAISFWQPREKGLFRAIERFAGVSMKSMRIPDRSDLLDRRREKLADRLRVAAAGELDEFTEFVGEVAAVVEQEGLDPARVTAAAVRLLWGDGPLSVEPEPEPVRAPAERKKFKKPGRAPGRADEADNESIVLPVGHTNGLRPGDVVGAIAGESGLPGSVIGNINILERVTFVSLPPQHVDRIMKALEGKKVRGRLLHPRRADEDGARRRPSSGPPFSGKPGKRPKHPRA